ncbi:MAG: UDP-2,3-diacylglucosamine diphosphatase [bacterium]
MIYFISDVHLGFYHRSKDKEREDLLLKVLEKISQDATELYLLGDIFDYWFEYKTVVPKYFYRTLASIKRLTDKGIKIEYLMGNHDFAHKTFFEEELEVRIRTNDIERTLEGKRFYLSHGDELNPADKSYKIAKSILRSSFNQWLYAKLHPDVAIKLASKSSTQSRKYSGLKYPAHDFMLEFAKVKIDQGFDYVIMGHRHKVSEFKYQEGAYLNLGDWLKDPRIAKFDGSTLIMLKPEEFLLMI